MHRLAGKPLALPIPGTSKPRRLSTAQWGPLTATADSDLFGRKGNRSSQCEHPRTDEEPRLRGGAANGGSYYTKYNNDLERTEAEPGLSLDRFWEEEC